MSIKPVDFQVMIPRTMEASKVSNDMTQKNMSAQQQQASAIRQRAEGSLKQVYSRTQAQNARISEKQKDNRKNDGKDKKNRNKGNKNEGNEKNDSKHEMITGTIDIKI